MGGYDTIETQKKTRILIIDDDQETAKTLSEFLTSQGYLTNHSGNGEDGLHRIKAWLPHLVLMNIHMHGFDGMKALERIRKMHEQEYTSVIFFAGNITTSEIVEGFELGVDDIVVRPVNVEELLARIRSKLRVKDLHDHLKRLNKRLEDLVIVDELTGLFNMRSLYRRLEQEIQRAQRYRKWLTCLMVDIDNFKKINDENDYAFGSWVLTQFAGVLRETSRAIDIVARYHGDRFLIILPETPLAGAERLAERIRKTIEASTYAQGKQKAKFTCSFGIAAVNSPTQTIDAKDFIAATEKVLTEAKGAGRNCVKTKLVT